MVVPSASDGHRRWAASASWARSGMMALSGAAGGAPLLPPVGLPEGLDALTSEIERLSDRRGHPLRLSWPAALAGRAALLDHRRRGTTSANGSCRLVPASDAWVALNLPRSEDRDLVAALTGGRGLDAWADVTRIAAGASADELVAQGRHLGLAVARVEETPEHEEPYISVEHGGPHLLSTGSPTVVDLSSLWAGPVVARVLAEVGARVIKVESITRPDGARATPTFYRWLHSRREVTVGVDLRTVQGLQRTADLLDDADVVIEGSRPRALEQLGLGPHDRAPKPGRVWLSITGYGRSGPGHNWIGFGDDTAAAGGLLGWDSAERPVFCGDAIADPVSGLVGALAVLTALDEGGGQLIDLALARVAAAMASRTNAPPYTDADADTDTGADDTDALAVERRDDGGWQVRAGASTEVVRERPESLEWIRQGRRG